MRETRALRYWAFLGVLATLAGMVACSSKAPEVVDATGEETTADQRPADARADAADGHTNDVPTLDAPRPDQLPIDQHRTDGSQPDQHDSTLPDSTADTAEDQTNPGPTVWGWISAIEWNDVCDQWYLKTQWNGGIRAYFAEGPNFNRALPHTLQFMTPKTTVGDCTLYDSGLVTDECMQFQCLCLDKGVECYEDNETKRWCDEDEWCVADPGLSQGEFSHGHCEPLPPHFDVGTVTIEGLKQAASMTPDEMGRYLVAATDPNDLFDKGDAITATTSGGDLPPMTFEAAGVAPLELADQVVTVRPNKNSTVTWIPADPGARVQIYLGIGSHDPNPLSAAILCDASDSQGQIEIDYSLLQQLFHLSCDGMWMMKCSRITRYTRDIRPMGTSQIELFVGSARNLQLLYE